MNLNHYPYSSCRRVVMGRKGAVATAHPLAVATGFHVLAEGGNAVDAAVAMAIALTVLEPTANGLGSDAFALVWDGHLHGLNASGKSPAALPSEAILKRGTISARSWEAVTVPGAVSAWQALWQRWGSMPFERLCQPAIDYAEDGYPVSPQVSRLWAKEASSHLSLQGPEFSSFNGVFFPKGQSPQAGSVWSSPGHAASLREIAQSGGDSFYRGNIAQQIVDFSDATNGYLCLEDLALHHPLWVEPISTTYRDVTVWELPPNGQGISALMALNILEGFDLAQYPRDSADSFHLQIEAMKLAFADAYHHVADPDYLQIDIDQMLSKQFANGRRQLIGNRALELAEPGLPRGGTVYLAAADGDLMVSLIQSNYQNFGAGIVVPSTGIALQNRGCGFSLDSAHPNCIAPGKRPFHTIIPSFLSRDGQPIGPMGVMGAHMQPQGHVQMVVNTVDYGMNIQSALDAPRWCFSTGNRVVLEQTVPQHVVMALGDRGHEVSVSSDTHVFGKGQLISRNPDGVLAAATEPRADGMALCW